MPEIKGFWLDGDYMGWITPFNKYMKFPTEEEYIEYIKELYDFI